MTVSIPSAVRAMQSMPAPVLALDTCSILDVARVPIRWKDSAQAARLVQAIEALVILAESNSPGIHIAVAGTVESEWTANQMGVHEEARRHFRELDVMHDVACSVGNALGLSAMKCSIAPLGIEKRLFAMERRMLASAKTLKTYAKINDAAIARVVAQLAPSRKGTCKDTVIYLHYLELLGKLRAAGFSEPCVLLSSNTRDYCGAGRKHPKPEIASELSTLSARFARNWLEARRLLGV